MKERKSRLYFKSIVTSGGRMEFTFCESGNAVLDSSENLRWRSLLDTEVEIPIR